MTLDRSELLTVLKGGKDLRYYTPEGHEADMGLEMIRRTEALGIRLRVRKVDERWELFAPKGEMPSDLKARCHAFRDTIIRAVWTKEALDYLRVRDIAYVPTDVEEDLDASYEEDTLDEFRENLRSWIKELVK